MEFIFEGLGFYVFAILTGFVLGLLTAKLCSLKEKEPMGNLIVTEDEDGSYLFLEAYEDVSEFEKKKSVIFDVSHKRK